MKRLHLSELHRRSLFLLALLLPLLVLFAHAALRTGPLAPVAVTVAEVSAEALTPSVFGIGTVAVRQLHKVGPTSAGRLASIGVDVGDRVEPGQSLAAMAPVDLGERGEAVLAAARRADALLTESIVRANNAASERQRHDELYARGLIAASVRDARRQDADAAAAAVRAARAERARIDAESRANSALAEHLVLRAPVAGVVVARHADPGSTLVAGQAVLEIVDPAEIWIDARFEQADAAGLAQGQAAQISLRSHPDETFAGTVARMEWLADAVTEELRAKIRFDTLPEPAPPIGELAELTVRLPPLAQTPVVPNAALVRSGGVLGVWMPEGDAARFQPVETGRSDLDGRVQVRRGVAAGDRIIVHRERTLAEGRRITIVEALAGTRP